MFIDIPTLPVYAYVEEVRVTNGQMEVPKNFNNVGRWNNVIAGHLDTPYGNGVFSDLRSLRRGDIILLEDKKYIVFKRRVMRSKSLIPLTDALLLITCTGKWTGKEYSHRLVIFAYEQSQ